MFSAFHRKTLIGILTLAFLFQSFLVYSDDRQEPLSEDALEGRDLWHQNSCQVCHQIYGQGGFLGPDLTNVASNIERSRLESLLTVGSGQMPAYYFSSQEISYMASYLDALDKPELGRGQLRMGTKIEGAGPWGSFGAIVATQMEEVDPNISEGYQIFGSRACGVCHTPLSESLVGAPDLSMAVEHLTRGELSEVLTTGRPNLGMPAPFPQLEGAEIGSLILFLEWLSDNRLALEGQLLGGSRYQESIEWKNIPWWEFR
jgi:nitric oxide reductase subunit C|tara:strand:- start:773 stop:1549 length:777 start_codon:yes stop_codon:yes gene_type:complete